MAPITYGLTGGLSRKRISLFHEKALQLVQEVGLKVPHERIRSILGDYGGVTIKGEMVYFAPHLVEKALSEQRYPERLVEGDFGIISGAYELNVLDLDTGQVRSATLQDLIELTKLADSYGMYGSAPVRPLDIPSRELQEIAMYKYSWENSPRRCNDVFEANEKSTMEVANYIYEMAQVAGKRFSLGFWLISPFKSTWTELEIIYRFLDKKVPMWVATMPIAGATAPIFLAGAYLQSLAELLAGLTMLNLINRGPEPPHCLVIDSIRAYPFDMKYGSFVYGSPEDLLATLIQTQLNARYGIPVVAKSLLTSAKEPDAQAAAEKASHTLAAALAGAKIFTNAGLLSVDEIYSAEQVVIDYEIVEYVMKVIKGFTFNEKSLALEAIKEVGPGGNFLDHETTLSHYREAFWMPELFEHPMLQQWQQMGSPTLRRRAREIARRKIAEHQYQLPGHIQKELDRIYEKARKQFG